MFYIDALAADNIRRAFIERGEASAVDELRRHIPDIAATFNVGLCVKTIAGWKPLPPFRKKRRFRTSI